MSKYCMCISKCYLNPCSVRFLGLNIPKIWLDYLTTALQQYLITTPKHQVIRPHGIHFLRQEKNVFSLNMQGFGWPFNLVQALCCSSLFTELSKRVRSCLPGGSLFSHLTVLHNSAVRTGRFWKDPGILHGCGIRFWFNSHPICNRCESRKNKQQQNKTKNSISLSISYKLLDVLSKT